MNFRISIIGSYPRDPMPDELRVALTEEIRKHCEAYGCHACIEFQPHEEIARRKL